MAYRDEKIAFLEREVRKQTAEEAAAKRKQDERTCRMKSFTLEEVLEAVREGNVVFQDGERLEVVERALLSGRVRILSLKDRFIGPEENGDTAVLVDHERGLSQMIALADGSLLSESMDAWKMRLEEGMKSMGLYAEVTGQKKLTHLDYLLYRMPSARGWIRNVAFRMKTEEGMAAGNYNCYEKDRETYGLLLEALVLRLDEILSEDAGTAHIAAEGSVGDGTGDHL